MKTAEDIDNAEDLIRYAFACRSIRLNASGSYEQASRGTNPAEVTVQDRITEGVMLYGLIMQNQGAMATQAIVAAHSREYDEKDEAIRTLGQNCATVVKMPVWCAIDGAWWWAHGEFRRVRNEPRDYTWWAGHLQRSYSTVYRWWKLNPRKREHPRTGEMVEGYSIREICSRHYMTGLAQAESNLMGKGWLQRKNYIV